jgi:signal peptidase I
VKKGLRIIVVVIIALILISATFRIMGFRALRYELGKDSMSPTIAGGDICLSVLNRKYSAADLRPGMIILFRHKGYSHLLTKRIIAGEGDLVEFRGLKTFVNRHVLNESYLENDSIRKEYGDVKKIEVPPNKLFVMGDNREHSLDSRYSKFGLIDVNQIVGKPLLFLWSDNKKKIGTRLQK